MGRRDLRPGRGDGDGAVERRSLGPSGPPQRRRGHIVAVGAGYSPGRIQRRRGRPVPVCAGENAFTEDHLRVLSAAATKVAVAVENALKYRQAERSAVTDMLTELPNARSLFLHLDSELSRAQRTGQTIAVLVCDLDGFKQINDRYGHLEGNRVLRAVARALRSQCREYDTVARLGGDEFVLVLPGQQPESVSAKVEQLTARWRKRATKRCARPAWESAWEWRIIRPTEEDAEALAGGGGSAHVSREAAGRSRERIGRLRRVGLGREKRSRQNEPRKFLSPKGGAF